MGALYRIRQFVRAAGKQGPPPDLGEMAGLLTADQRRLFAAMAVVDQEHCLRVARTLRAAGHSERSLLQAALLHDCGKSVTRIAVWERVAHVLLQRLAPALPGRLGSSRPGGVGHGLHVLAHHTALGAELAAQAGCPPETIDLLRGAGEPRLQSALAQADDTQ